MATGQVNKLRHWEVLSRTEINHTRHFQRRGGFSGTAIKPIYCIQKMTEHFGPVGIGWGYTKPEFSVHQIGDVALVFCSLGLWYMDGDKKSDLLWGEGGDYIAVKRKDGGIDCDDEGFKKAQTDALGNAMKLVGMSADVHLGMFEDHKYVQELKEEAQQRERGTVPDKTPPKTKMVFEIYDLDGVSAVEAERPRDWCKNLLAMLDMTKPPQRLEFWKLNEPILQRVEGFVKDMKKPNDRKAAETFIEGFKKQVLQLLPASLPPVNPGLNNSTDSDGVPF